MGTTKGLIIFIKRKFKILVCDDDVWKLERVLLGLHFNSEDGGITLLRKVCKLIPDYMASHAII
jgi:hypothetical protein